MHLPARNIPIGAVLDFDVCIIGAGPAGLTVAAELSTGGRRICIVESGGIRPSPASRELSRGRVAGGLPYVDLRNSRVRAIGGSSWRWLEPDGEWSVDGGLRCRPFDALDLSDRPHVPGAAWPITRSSLDPYYRRAHELVGLSTPLYDLDAWRDSPAGRPLALPRNAVETTISQFAPADRFITLGARLRARESVTVITGATVAELVAAESSSRIDHARIVTRYGHASVRAGTFVIAGGGIENARTLLLSPIGRPGGAANRHDQVGRSFMEHPHIESGVFRPSSLAAIADLGFYFRHVVRDTALLGALRIPDAVQQREGLLNSVVTFKPRAELFLRPSVRSFAELRWSLAQRSRPTALRRHLRAVATDPVSISSAVASRFRSGAQPPAVASLVITTEQAPNPASRVTLSSKRDPFGLPVPSLDWRLTPLDDRSIRRTQDLIGDALAAHGYGTVEAKWGDVDPPPRIHGCWHHIGTTRMSRDPRTGVVDADCRLHGMENLYVAGSSVFPTAGATTITLSIVAFAIRLADHLRRG